MTGLWQISGRSALSFELGNYLFGDTPEGVFGGGLLDLPVRFPLRGWINTAS
jgi:hypothetical protein